MKLFVAMLMAPLVARDEDAPDVLHAVTADAVVKGWPEGPLVTACGVGDVRLFPLDEGEAAAPWPPRVASLPKGKSRCRACFDATSEKRPRCQFVRAGVPVSEEDNDD